MKTLSFLFLVSTLLIFSGCEDESLTLSSNRSSDDLRAAGLRETNSVKSQNGFYLTTGSVSRFEFDLRVHHNGQLIVDWGDGKKEKVHLTNEGQNFIGHNYDRAGEYRVTFNGNVKNIYAFITSPAVKNINTNTLKSLEILLLTHSYVPVYDLRANTKLQQIIIRALADHTRIHMPLTHDILFASFNDSSIENIDDVLSSIYRNAVAKEIFGGTIYLENLRQHYPSSESLANLEDLSENYDWEIVMPE